MHSLITYLANLQPLPPFKPSKPWWKINLSTRSRSSKPTMGESTLLVNSISSVNMLEFATSFTCSKMVELREKIEAFWGLQEQCYNKQVFLMDTGKKPLQVHATYTIAFPQAPTQPLPPTLYGSVNPLSSTIFASVGLQPTCFILIHP